MRRWPARASLAIVVALLALNLAALARNYQVIASKRRPHLSPTEIGAVARLSDNPEVSAGMAAYYLLGDHLAGRTLVIPARELDHRFWLEQVARLRIEVVAEPIAASAPRGEVVQRFELYDTRVSNQQQRLRTVELIVVKGAERYELADRGDGELVIQPAGTSLMPK